MPPKKKLLRISGQLSEISGSNLMFIYCDETTKEKVEKSLDSPSNYRGRGGHLGFKVFKKTEIESFYEEFAGRDINFIVSVRSFKPPDAIFPIKFLYFEELLLSREDKIRIIEKGKCSNPLKN